MDEEKQEKLDSEAPESIYKGLKNVPLKVLDLIIALCIAALVITIAVGVLNR